jgi:TonB-linked SusC/RagA family outer membrane protein
MIKKLFYHHSGASLFAENPVKIVKSICLLVLLFLGVSVAGYAAENTQQVRGMVIDSKGDPIIGATVRVKGGTQGAQTDLNGHFQLMAPANATLIVSYVGYATKEIKPENGVLPDKIVLEESSQELEDIVVTAFGSTQKKETMTGAVQSIRPDELIAPTSNLSNTFAGRLAGVVAFQRSGEPGKSGSEFYIRGISTLSGMTSPLIILDGLEVSSADLDALDPEVIEGFSILKDATASAMYGTRGANGVMIVKTKSGANLERPIIGVRVETYIAMPTSIPKFVDGATYMELKNEALTNEGASAEYIAEQIRNTRSGVDPYMYPNVSWYDELFQSYAVNQKANFNIRGGTKKIVYFMNMTINHENTILRDRAQEFHSYSNSLNVLKYAFQNNIDFHLSETSTISLHLNAQLNDKHSPIKDTKDIYEYIIQKSNPVDFPVYYPADGKNPWVYWGLQGANIQGSMNAVAEATKGYRDIFESTVLVNLDFDQKLDFLTEGLSFKAKASLRNWNKSERKRESSYNTYTLRKKNADGTYELRSFRPTAPEKPVLNTDFTQDGDRRMYAQAFFNYERTFGKYHNVGGLLLWNIDQFNNNVKKESDDYNTVLTYSLPKRKMGYAMRFTYDYAYRYLLELNAGYNGSENFAEGHRWGFFPSAAVGWNLTQEPFFEQFTDVISNLKLRGSYGLVGNDQIKIDDKDARFIYMGEVDLGGSAEYITGYDPALQQTYKGPKYIRYENPGITWEVGAKLNVGMDLRLFRDLSVVVDVFREIRSNIFQQMKSIPNYFGTADTKVFGNLAKVKNSGFDIALNYGKVVNEDLMVELKSTFTCAHNVVLEYDEGTGLRPARSKVGQNTKQLTGLISDGLYIDYADIAHNPFVQLGGATEPGDIKYVDQPDENGYYDGLITTDDKVPIGYPEVPEIVYGFGPSVQWKNWDFSFFMQGVARTSLMMKDFYPFGRDYNRNVLQWIADDHWSPNNQNISANYPRLTRYENKNNTEESDFWLRDASFLKLKNLEIGYRHNFKSSKGSSVRIYVSGANLLTFSEFKYWDPEMGGGKGLSYPPQKIFNVGVQMTLK